MLKDRRALRKRGIKETMNFEIRPIGYVRSPYKETRDAPRQRRLSKTVSEIIIEEQYLPGLDGVETK